jgi:multicomponent Na+:H+ antiporter subunit F
MELVQQYSVIFYGILSVLALMLVCCLIRAVKGPRIADRLVAVNMMGTMVMVMIALLAVVKDQGYLVDICLIYAMISFLAVVVLTRIYTGVYRDAKAHENKKGEKKHADS